MFAYPWVSGFPLRVSMALPKASPYAELFRHRTIKMIEDGRHSWAVNLGTRKPRQGCDVDDDLVQSLGWGMMVGPFAALAVVAVVAVVTLVLELAASRVGFGFQTWATTGIRDLWDLLERTTFDEAMAIELSQTLESILAEKEKLSRGVSLKLPQAH